VFSKDSLSGAPRELRLVTACAMWPPSGQRTDAIQTAAAPDLDWDRVHRLAIRHRVVGLLHHGLRHIAYRPPNNISAQIRAQAFELARQNLLLAAEALKLERLFAAADLPIAFLKGTSLAVLAYGNCGIRHSKDIDLLIDPELALTAFSILEDAGYQRCNLRTACNDHLKAWMREAHHLTYVHSRSGTQVEVHWRLFRNQNLDPRLKHINARLSPSAPDETGALEDVLVYLCIHGAMHKWFRLKWLADVAALLAHTSEAARESLYHTAAARGAGPYVGQALLLCHGLLGVSVSPKLLVDLKTNRLLRRLERIALDKITMVTYEGEPETWSLRARLISTAHNFMLPGWSYRRAELRMLFTSLEDLEQFRLPRPLGFLYPLLRLPLWLQRKFR
jgi:putative nucleotidyltransferase-like protein